MSKLRSVNTHFWNDNYIIELDPIEKLLFLYLLTNEQTNMLGIYELNLRKIAFDTGIDKEMVSKIFGRFHSDGKASYIDGYVCLHNFTKHQAYNQNMKKSALSCFNELPEKVRIQHFCKPLLKGLRPFPKGFEPEIPKNTQKHRSDESVKGKEPLTKGSEPIAEIEVEREREVEGEGEGESARVNGCPIPKELQGIGGLKEKYEFYCEYMRENYNRWPTSTTTQMDLQKLVELKQDGNDPIKVIEQTIQGRNKSFFPLRDYDEKTESEHKVIGDGTW